MYKKLWYITDHVSRRDAVPTSSGPLHATYVHVGTQSESSAPYLRIHYQNRGHSLLSFYSSLKGATELKFVLFCSS